MKEILKAGYTLTFGGECENISGGYLKATPQGMKPIWQFPEEEIRLIKSFPNVFSTLRENRILQLYYSCGNYVAMIGEKHFELPYAEQEYLEVEGISRNETPVLALADLDSQLIKENAKPKQYVKAYKFYGSDKYQMESLGGKNEK